MKLTDLDAVKNFARKYIVDEKYVMDYLRHISAIETRKKKGLAERKAKRQARANLSYTDINWRELYEADKLQSLLVRELKLYLEHHGIEEGKYKEDNVRIVKAHIGSMLLNEMVPEQNHPDEIRSAGRNQNSDDSGDSSSGLDQDLDGYADDDTSDEDTSDEEEILDVIGTSSSSEGSPAEEEESSAEEEESPAEGPTSRYGRRRADFRQQGCISWDNIQFVDRP